jgi:chromosomal replication initiator protein
MPRAKSLTDQIVPALAERIGMRRFQIWFEGKTKFTLEGERLTVGVSNLFYQEWLTKSFLDDLRAVAAALFGKKTEVRLVIDPELFQASRADAGSPGPPKARSTKDAAETPPPATGRRRGEAEPAARGRTKWKRLADFVVGPCNRLAHAAAMNVIDRPEEVPCPLTFFGPTGVGKTHLLEGIYRELVELLGEGSLQYLTAEEFLNRFQSALQAKQMPAFRKQFRECQGLFLDNLQFLAGKESTQMEFLHTFETLMRQGRPVVVTCDAHPRFLTQLAPELADRLLGGAIWEIESPAHATRVSFLKARSAAMNLNLSKEAIGYLADRVRGNMRELEGVLNTIRHFANVHERPVTMALVREATAGLFKQQTRIVGLQDVERAVGKVMNVDVKSLHQQTRARAVSHPRMIVMFLARRHTGASYSEIARYFGGKSHSTVVSAEKKVQEWLEENAPLFAAVDRCPMRDLIETIERELLRGK